MRQWIFIGSALAMLGCTPTSTPSPTPSGQVSALAGDRFELMGRESTITFIPDESKIHIGSMLRLGTEGTSFTLPPVKSRKLEEILLDCRPQVISLSERLVSTRALLAMEHKGIRYVASANAPQLKAAREALEIYAPRPGAIGPDSVWLMGKLEGVKGRWTVTTAKEKFRLTGPATELAFRPGTPVLVVGAPKKDHLYEAARISEWYGPERSFLDLPPLEAKPAPAEQYNRDPATGLLTSRVRILVNLKEGVGIKELPKLLGAAGDKARIIACWPDNMVLLLEIPDSQGLAAVQAAVVRLEKTGVVESAAADVALGEAGDSFRRPEQ